jgi:hypothetical protein
MGHFAAGNGGYHNFKEIQRISEDASMSCKHDLKVQDCRHDSSDVEMEAPAQDDDMSVLTSTDIASQVRAEVEVTRAGDDFVEGLKDVLLQWAETAGEQKTGSHFRSHSAPNLSIGAYIDRIRMYFKCSDECFVVALAYIDRARKNDARMVVCDCSTHRLVFVAMMIAAKFLDDVYYSNTYYARVGGVSLKEANKLEAEMLQSLCWRVHVLPEEYMLFHELACRARQS